MLKVNKTLKTLSLSPIKEVLYQCSALAESLQFNKTLTHLYLSCKIVDVEAKKLFECLKNNHTLTSLLFVNVEIKNNEDLLNSIMRTNTNLMSLSFYNIPKITDQVAHTLFNELEHNCSLTGLNFSNKKKCDRNYTFLIPKLYKNFSLKRLQLGHDIELQYAFQNHICSRNIEFARKVKAFVVKYFCSKREDIRIKHFHIFKIYQKISKIALKIKMVKIDKNNEGIIQQIDNYIHMNYFLIRGVSKQRSFGKFGLPLEIFTKIISYLGQQSLWVDKDEQQMKGCIMKEERKIEESKSMEE